MHYKKRKLHKLHCIPIGLCNNKYLVSYSIPLSCMVVLLLMGIIAINPSLALKTSAVTIQDEWVVKENNSTSENTESVGDSFGGFGGDEVELSQEDMDAGISPMSIVASPTLAITVSNSNQTIDAVQGGNTVYGSYNVGITGSNVKDYTLSIKADAVNLVSPSQASTPTTITGAGGKTGDSMNANTWGYKLTETSTAESSYGTLNYASLPTTLTQIANGTVSSPYNLSANKKLVFAAKFSDTAAPGTYKGHITLSAVANQAVVSAIWSNGVDSGITDMQDITSNFCSSSIPAGSTITLKDNRGTSPISYKIIKMGDGTCWMAENLRLTNTTINSTNSDIASGSFIIPASDPAMFNTSVYNWLKTAGVYYDGDRIYGAYYNWFAATAGAGNADVASGTVSASICPKGWKLPNYDGVGSFYNIINGTDGYKSSWTSIDGKYGYKLGYNSDDAFWPAAGYVSTDTNIYHTNSEGTYWSSQAVNSNYANGLTVSSYGAYPQSGNNRYLGCSIRCVASY